MTRALTRTRTISSTATAITMLGAIVMMMMLSTSPAHAQAPDGEGGRTVVIDCWDPEKGHLVPCDEIDPDVDVDEEPQTPSECPDGTHAVPNAAGGFTCVEDEEPDCDDRVVRLVGSTADPCDEPTITCERVEYAHSNDIDVPAHIQDWYDANCVDDDYSCRELAHAIEIGALLSQDAWDWYHEHCDTDDGRTCESIQQAMDDGLLITRMDADWYERNCERDELRCDELQGMLDAGKRLTEAQQKYYDERCDDGDERCEDREDCDDGSEDCTRNCDDRTPTCVPGNECPSDDEEDDETEVSTEPRETPRPPKAGTGAEMFDVIPGGGPGMASLTLIAAGGAIAGGLLRRKSA